MRTAPPRPLRRSVCIAQLLALAGCRAGVATEPPAAPTAPVRAAPSQPDDPTPAAATVAVAPSAPSAAPTAPSAPPSPPAPSARPVPAARVAAAAECQRDNPQGRGCTQAAAFCAGQRSHCVSGGSRQPSRCSSTEWRCSCSATPANTLAWRCDEHLQPAGPLPPPELG